MSSPATARIREWRQDPVSFVRSQFHADPDEWQKEVLVAFADPAKPRLAMKACAGPGKTTTLAWCGWNFLTCYAEPGEHPKGSAISITKDNLDINLWPELAKWRDRSPFLQSAFEMNSERIYARDHSDTWFLANRGWPKTASTEEMGKTLSGLHSLFPFALVDESGAIPAAVMRAVDQMLSRYRVGKVVQAGNPLSLEGMLYAACTTLAHQWYVVTITGDPDEPKAWVNSERIKATLGSQPADWARTQIETYGRDNPWVKVYILGQFPPSSLNALLSEEEVRASMAMELPADAYTWAQGRLGVDVARFGDDRTVIFPRQGKRAFAPEVMRHGRDSAVSTDIATKILTVQERTGFTTTIMDATGGWAAGARDVLVAGGHTPISVQFHRPGLDLRYKNRRSELHFAGAEWVKQQGWLPNIPEIIAEASAATYTFVNGQFMIEPKDQIKARLGRSPDLWEAFLLTHGIPEVKAKTKPVERMQILPSTAGGWMGG